MAKHLMVRDSVTHREERSTTTLEDLSAIYSEVLYEVTDPGGATLFPAPSGATIGASNKVQLHRNGQELNEGASLDYTRDTGNNRLVTNYVIPQNAKVLVRVYPG